MIRSKGTLAQRPNGPLPIGFDYSATDTGQWFEWNGGAWIEMGGDVMELGSVEVTGTAGAIRGDGTLHVNGILLTEGDHIHKTAESMYGTGTLIDDPGTSHRLPRWQLPDAATHSVKCIVDIPFEWDQVDIVIGWNNEVATTGDVRLNFDYRFIMPFAADLVDDAGDITTVNLGAVAAPSTQFAWEFLINSSLQNIAVANGPFQEKPMMLCTITRLGGDAADTLAGAVSISTLIANRFV